MKLMSRAAVILSLQMVQPSILKDKEMFDLDIILNFNLTYETRKRYLNKVMKKKGFTYLGNGRHRITYLSPNKRFVLKFPKFREGVVANRNEAFKWKAYLNNKVTVSGARYAPCRLLQDCIIMMVAVVEAYGGTCGDDSARDSGAIGGEVYYSLEKSLPEWVDDIDACQVGKLANGKLVAYDYA